MCIARRKLGFATCDDFWPLLVVGGVGTLNPSSGDVSVFLPVEQAVLAGAAVATPARTGLFAVYNVVGTFAGALGALAAGAPYLLARYFDVGVQGFERGVFVLYASLGVVSAGLYARLPSEAVRAESRRPLSRSRSIVLHLAAPCRRGYERNITSASFGV
jgi:hypothetical protein